MEAPRDSKTVGGVEEFGMAGQVGEGQVAEDLRAYAAVDEFLEDRCRVGLQADGERPVFSNLVFDGAKGLVESVDDEVAGAGADNLLDVRRVVFEREADGSGDIRGEGKGCALEVEADGKDECTGPCLTRGRAQSVEGGEGAEDTFLLAFD